MFIPLSLPTRHRNLCRQFTRIVNGYFCWCFKLPCNNFICCFLSLTFSNHITSYSCMTHYLHQFNHTSTSEPFYCPFPGTPSEPMPEENFWTLWCKARLTEADTLTIRLGATPSGLTSAHLHHSPIFFYRPDALLAAQPTTSAFGLGRRR